MAYSKTGKVHVASMIALALIGIFAPDLDTFVTSGKRYLTAEDASTYRPTGTALTCGPGQQTYSMNWKDVVLDPSLPSQTLTMSNGLKIKMTVSTTGVAKIDQFSQYPEGWIVFGLTTIPQKEDVITPNKVGKPSYPISFITMDLEFDRDLTGLMISTGDIDSTKQGTDVVRIRMFDGVGATATPLTFTSTGTITVKDDFAYEIQPDKATDNPGYTSSLYAKATGKVRKIRLDESLFVYSQSEVGKQFSFRRGVFPALDFVYCDITLPPTFGPTRAPTIAPTPVPTIVPTLRPVVITAATPIPTMPPTKIPTFPPTVSPTFPPTIPPTFLPTMPPTFPPTMPPTFPPTMPPVLAPIVVPQPLAPVAPVPMQIITAGVNGDPLIMGLSGQLFNFHGRSGAWYSAVSTPTFQWNMQIQKFETCPAYSDTFVSGAGFNFLDKFGKVSKSGSIEVNVVNAYNVDVGCGDDGKAYCLGAGSLEIIIDGIKHNTGGDFFNKDGSVRILAFNTFYQCSRRWYDFRVRDEDSTLTKTGRRLGRKPMGVFDVISGLEQTMIHREDCEMWIEDRKKWGDLFVQPGHYSTVIIQTADITLHLEYKQENERCNAHSIDVWIASVSPSLMNQQWEGVIGETKHPAYLATGEQRLIDRLDALKYSSDEAYEVNAPFSTNCIGCFHK